MTHGDAIREAGHIVDRATRNVVAVLVIARGLRLAPAELESLRGVLSSAIAEGMDLGQRYIRERRSEPPPPHALPEDDTSSTRPGFRSRFPKKS